MQLVVHHANPFAEPWFKSGSFQNSHQEPMVNPIKGLRLIQIDQCVALVLSSNLSRISLTKYKLS